MNNAARPSKPVIVYDGDCAFCRRSIGNIQRRDRYNAFDYRPRQEPGIEEELPQLTLGDFNEGLRYIDTTGDVLIGADAIHKIVGQLPYWRRIAWLYRLPVIGSIARWVYARIAANRMKLSRYCTPEDACSIAPDAPPKLDPSESN